MAICLRSFHTDLKNFLNRHFWSIHRKGTRFMLGWQGHDLTFEKIPPIYRTKNGDLLVRCSLFSEKNFSERNFPQYSRKNMWVYMKGLSMKNAKNKNSRTLPCCLVADGTVAALFRRNRSPDTRGKQGISVRLIKKDRVMDPAITLFLLFACVQCLSACWGRIPQSPENAHYMCGYAMEHRFFIWQGIEHR